MSELTGVQLSGAAAARLRQVRIPDGRATLTNTQLIAEAQVFATLALAEETRVQNALMAIALGTSGLDLAKPEQARGEVTKIRQIRMNALRTIVREEFGIDDGD